MNIKVKDMTIVAVMTAVLCIISPWSIPLPIGPVSITLGSLGVLLSACILGAKKGTLAVLLYILIGMAGLPVFSQFRGGVSVLAGPTGGYIIGYIFMALITGIAAELFENKIWLLSCGMVLGTIILYLFGTMWLAYGANMSFGAALMSAVIPFIPGDIAKIAAAAVLHRAVRPKLKHFIESAT